MAYVEAPALGNKGEFKFKFLSWNYPGKGNMIVSVLRIQIKIMKHAWNIGKRPDHYLVLVSELSIEVINQPSEILFFSPIIEGKDHEI